MENIRRYLRKVVTEPFRDLNWKGKVVGILLLINPLFWIWIIWHVWIKKDLRKEEDND